jgi:hypothetical protein
VITKFDPQRCTKGQKGHKRHKGSNGTSKVYWTISNHLIPKPYPLCERGSQTACNCKLGYHDSCTLCKGSAMYPWVLISSLRGRLEKPPFYHSYTSFGVCLRDHYLLLQRSTTGVYHALLWFPEQTVPACSAKDSHTNLPSAPCGSGSSQSMSQWLITKCGAKLTQPSTTHNLSYS